MSFCRDFRCLSRSRRFDFCAGREMKEMLRNRTNEMRSAIAMGRAVEGLFDLTIFDLIRSWFAETCSCLVFIDLNAIVPEFDR